jgi:hypothetical protein
VDQVELHAPHRTVRCKRATNQSRFVGAIHPVHVQSQISHMMIMRAQNYWVSGRLGDWVIELCDLAIG